MGKRLFFFSSFSFQSAKFEVVVAAGEGKGEEDTGEKNYFCSLIDGLAWEKLSTRKRGS